MKNVNLILMIVFAGQVFAGPRERNENPLGLTETQQEQMHELKLKQREKLKAAHEQVMAESKVEMAKFLTEEQMAQFESMQERRKERGQKHRHDKKGKKRGFKREPIDE